MDVLGLVGALVLYILLQPVLIWYLLKDRNKAILGVVLIYVANSVVSALMPTAWVVSLAVPFLVGVYALGMSQKEGVMFTVALIVAKLILLGSLAAVVLLV